MPEKTPQDLTGVPLTRTSHLIYSRGRTIPLCAWYFPFLSL